LSTTLRRSCALAATVVIAIAVPAVAATPATAQAALGYVRLAHLSPDTPEVDVYLSSQSGAIDEQVFKGVGYGVLSDYQALPVGGYTVAMRQSGAPSSAPAVLTTQVSVTAGGAYTVAGVGRYADLGLRVLDDDLTLPAGNKSKVRIVQASVQAPVLGVALANGSSIADNVAFATTTNYQLVEPGTWRLVIRPASGGAVAEIDAKLGEGSVYSLLVLDAPSGGLEGRLTVDASRAGGIPAGGVETGAGGGRSPGTLGLLVIGVVVFITAAAVGFVARQRRHSRVL
jgi:hypothetical protein